jgi:SulP family sulfate permease
VIGVAVLITVGRFDDIFGYKPQGESNRVVAAFDILVDPGNWQPATVAVGLATIAGMFALKAFRPTRRVALVVGVVLGTIMVSVFDTNTELISDVACIPSGLDDIPTPTANDLPDLSLMPEILAGSLAVALVAHAQGRHPTRLPQPNGSPVGCAANTPGVRNGVA